MSILSVDNISPIGSGTSVTVNSAATLVLTNANSTGVITATSFVGSGANLTGVLSNIVEDTSPQLGGNLDVNTKNIVFGDSGSASDDRLTFGAGTDLSIYHDGTYSNIYNNTNTTLRIINGGNAGMLIQNQNSYNIEIKTNAEDAIKCVANGAVELYHDNSKMFETLSVGTKTYGQHQISTGDNSYLALLNTNGQGTAYLRNYQGDLLIESPDDVTIESGSSEIMAKFIGDGAAELYHDNSKKFETMSTGARIQGGLLFNSDTAAANTLDDYEEGTWTATLSGNSSPANVTTNNTTTTRQVTGTYRKIGSLVHVQALWTNLQYNGSNDMHNHQLQHITGIPFTSGNASGTSVFTAPLGYSRGIYGRYANVIIEECVLYFWMGTASTTVYLQASQIVQNSPGTLYHTVSNSSSSMYYAFNMTYHTN